LYVTFGLTIDKLWGFEDFSLSSGMLSATMNAGKSAQNCQNLPKDETLKYHQKLRFYNFSKIKISTCTRGNRACFHRLDFQSKKFSYANFIVKKRPLYVNFSTPLCGKQLFWQLSTTLVNIRFCTHVPNSNKKKNMKSGNPYLRWNMVFLAFETLQSLSGTVEKNFFLQL
jgi:hypothetical protein